LKDFGSSKSYRWVVYSHSWLMTSEAEPRPAPAVRPRLHGELPGELCTCSIYFKQLLGNSSAAVSQVAALAV